MQLDDKEMTFGDRRHYFSRPLPPDLGFHISNLNPHTMSDVYDISRNWARHKRFAQAGHKTDRAGEQRPAKPVPPIVFPSSSTAPSSTAMPVPMDLDSFEPQAKQPPTGPRSRQDMTKVRCYNCNKMGHYSKNCRLPRNPPHNPNGNNASLNGQAKRNYPRSASQSMFHFGDPQPIRPHRARDAAQPYPPQTLLQKLDKESRRHIRFTQKDVDKFLESCEPAKLNDRPPPPLDLHLLNLDNEVSEGLPVLVETILDTAAPDNYVRRSVAEAAHMDIFRLRVPKDIAGAGYTTTVAFAKFTLQIGDIKDTTLAYILEEDSGFRYDLLLGRNSPKTHATVRIQAIRSPIRSPSPPVNQGPIPKVEDLYTLSNTSSDDVYSDLPDLMDVEDSDDEDEEDNEEDCYADDEADYDEPLKPFQCSEDIAHPPEPTTPTTKHPCKLGLFAKKRVVVGSTILILVLHSQSVPEAVHTRRKTTLSSRSLSMKPFSTESLKNHSHRGLHPLFLLRRRMVRPLPRIDECYVNLKDAEVFTTLDLRSGYWQIRLDNADKEKTAFTATFQNMMNDILRPYIDKSVMVYLDDIIIALDDEGLVLNSDKCSWAQSEILYLGHYVSGDGIQVNPDKIKAILEWPVPKTITDVRGFINLAGYYRRYIPAFADMADAMYDLLRGSPKKGTPIASTRMLIHPTPWHVFVIDSDASGTCIGAVLQQSGQSFRG